MTRFVNRKIAGNYELNLVLMGGTPSQKVKVFFSGNKDASRNTYLEISNNDIKIVRQTRDGTVVLKRHEEAGDFPWKVRILKKGNFFRFYTGNAQVGLRTIPIAQLTNWESEGGKTFNMLVRKRALVKNTWSN